MAGQVVMALYRPHERDPETGRSAALEAILAEHVPALRREGLASARPVLLLQSPADGTYVEIFEWLSAEAAEAAHRNATVIALWERIGAVARIRSLADLPDALRPFPQFRPIEDVVL